MAKRNPHARPVRQVVKSVAGNNPAQAFVEEYNALVQKHGFMLVAQPQWIPRDDSTWSLVTRLSVEPVPQQNAQPGMMAGPRQAPPVGEPMPESPVDESPKEA
jgi:hypothetical protein